MREDTHHGFLELIKKGRPDEIGTAFHTEDFYYSFFPPPLNNATSIIINTAPPTIQTHGC